VQSKVQKWGNSLAVRLPKAFADELGIDQGTAVELSIDQDRLLVIPKTKKAKALARLVAKVTPENMHGEVDTGARVGRETW
jgi:antitoxin MazE